MTRNAGRPVAVCFFGITRSLTRTIASIEKNVLVPARTQGQVKVYAHFFQQKEVENPRSGEKGSLDQTEHRLLAPDWLQMEAPDTCLARWNFDGLKHYGDYRYWNDGFRSMRNLVHQLHSLHEVTEAVLADGAEQCLFCRPDLRYHDSLARPIRAALRARGDLVQVPYWQPWHALNDRFAIVSGRAAIAAYGQRIRLAHQFCAAGPRPLHSEQLLKYAIDEAGLAVRTIAARASRVRMDGTQVVEDFTYPGTVEFRRKYRVDINPVIRLIKGGA